jgi:glutamate synthase domain-containing protein 2
MAPRRCIPYLAIETLESLHDALPGDLAADKAVYNYIKAVGKGLSKIMSKMGVSTYMSYCGAQLFEAIGLEKELVEKYFRGTASQVGGIGVFEVAEEAIRMHRGAFSRDPLLEGMLDAGGEYAWRVRGEEHMWTPDAIAKLQHSARANRFETYKEYAQIINDQSHRLMTLRGLFRVQRRSAKSIPARPGRAGVGDRQALRTGAMSLGSISTEAHATLAVAMNRIGGKSNTGEGGEDPARYREEMKGNPIAEGHPLQRDHRQGRHHRRLRAEAGRLAALEDQAGGVGPLRGHHRVPGFRRPAADQDGAGGQAGRGRAAPRR